MKTALAAISSQEEWALPWNLCEWFDKAVLCRWIIEEVETLDWSNPEVVEFLRAHPSYQPKMLLCLMTYAYATAIYESEEIVRRCYSEETFRQLSRGRPPENATWIRRFRRENRGLLKWCLMRLFKRAAKTRLDEPFLPAGLKRRLLDAALMRLNVARQIDSGELGL
ncbi:MAG: transposase [Chloroflexi bacterium]|nr:transposase [Chloroflexota bacterium]